MNGELDVTNEIFFPPRTNDVDRHVGRRLRLVRELNSLSQGEFAQRLGINTDELARYEIGEERIPASQLFNAASGFEVPGAWFFEDLASTRIDSKTGHPEIDVQVVELTGLIKRISEKHDLSDVVENAQNRLHEIRNFGHN